MRSHIVGKLLDPGQLAHAYVLTGSQAGAWAKEFIQALFCKAACGACAHCLKLAHDTHPDVCWVRPEGKNIKIEQVRALQKGALYPPHEANHKVYVIENAEFLSREASNSLLKLLEAPPAYVVFLLLTQRLGELLPTVLSRCRLVRGGSRALEEQVFEACWGNPAWLEAFAADGAEFPPLESAPEALAVALAGSDLALLHAATKALFEALKAWTAVDVLQLSAALGKMERPNLEYALQGLVFLSHKADAFPSSRALEGLRRLSLSYGALRGNANPQLLVESFLLTLWRSRRKA